MTVGNMLYLLHYVRVCDVFTVVSVSMYLFEAWLCCVVVCLLRVCVCWSQVMFF